MEIVTIGGRNHRKRHSTSNKGQILF